MASEDGKGKGRNFQARWCDAVATDERLGGTDVTVAWRLASYADADGTNAWPGNLRLARDCRLEVSTDPKNPEKGGRCKTVERVLKRLLDLGYLNRSKHPGNARLWVYRLTLPETATPDTGVRGQVDDEPPGVAAKPTDSQEGTPGQPRTPESPNPGHQRPATNPVTNPGDSAPTERARHADSQADDSERAAHADVRTREQINSEGLEAVRMALRHAIGDGAGP